MHNEYRVGMICICHRESFKYYLSNASSVQYQFPPQKKKHVLLVGRQKPNQTAFDKKRAPEGVTHGDGSTRVPWRNSDPLEKNECQNQNSQS